MTNAPTDRCAAFPAPSRSAFPVPSRSAYPVPCRVAFRRAIAVCGVALMWTACGGGGGPPAGASTASPADPDAVSSAVDAPDGASVTDAGPGFDSVQGGRATLCSGPRAWESAVRLAGAGDVALLPAFAAALVAAGYHVEDHSDDPPVGVADAGGEGDATAAVPPYVVGRDKLQDAVFLLENGDLVVASACPIDGLDQIRRLDWSLAAAIDVLAAAKGGIAYADKVALWALPTAWYSGKAGIYQRQLLHPALDLNKPHDGTLSCTVGPIAAGFGLIGHADVPSAVGDVVGVETLSVAGVVIAQAETIKTTGPVALFWPLAGLVDGAVSWHVDLMVADASVKWDVGVYRPFVEALFPPAATAALVVSLQGAPPGESRVSRSIAELVLP